MRLDRAGLVLMSSLLAAMGQAKEASRRRCKRVVSPISLPEADLHGSTKGRSIHTWVWGPVLPSKAAFLARDGGMNVSTAGVSATIHPT